MLGSGGLTPAVPSALKPDQVRMRKAPTVLVYVYIVGLGRTRKGEEENNELDSEAIKPPGFVQYISQRRLIHDITLIEIR
jgi:hypothetical protein